MYIFNEFKALLKCTHNERSKKINLKRTDFWNEQRENYSGYFKKL